MIEDKVLDTLIDSASSPTAHYISIPSATVIELVKAYRYHKRVLPLHQAIAEACEKLGY